MAVADLDAAGGEETVAAIAEAGGQAFFVAGQRGREAEVQR